MPEIQLLNKTENIFQEEWSRRMIKTQENILYKTLQELFFKKFPVSFREVLVGNFEINRNLSRKMILGKFCAK